MEWDLFEDKMNNQEYEELEKILNKNNNELIVKYQLGIVYSCQYEKKQKAIDIFKELIEMNFHKQYIYIFLAEHTFDYKERVNIIKCGVSLFPKNEILNRFLLEITTNSSEGEMIYLNLSDKDCLVDYDNLKMAELYYQDKKYERAIGYLDKIDLQEQNDYANNYIVLLKNICNYYLKNNINLKEIRKYTIGNLKKEFGYLGFYLEIAHYINKKDYKKTNELIINLPYNVFSDTFFEVFVKNGRYPCYFEFENLLNDINSIILELDEVEKKSKNKIETLKIVYKLQYDYEEIKLSKKEIKEYIKIIKAEFFENKEECLVEIYFDLLMKNKNEEEAINFMFENYLYSFRYDKVIDFEKYEFSLSSIKLIYSKMLSRSLRTEINKKEEELIVVLIKLLYMNKEYIKVCDVSEKYESKIDFQKKDVLFEIAYSYAEIENDVKAEKLYLKILKKDKNNSSVLNNLGIIYEKHGKIDKALEHLQKAESINHNEIHIRNIKRCNITLEEKKKNQEEMIEGKENIKKENIFIINKFLSFCEHQNDSGDIICSYSELPIFLNINAEKANEVLNTFLRKKYLFKQINHSYDTNKSVYKINNDVESEIINIKNNNKLMNDVANKLNNISLEKMENMNLNDKFSKISSITNTEICSILKRDYYELFMAYTIDNQKSVTILAGGIIETILIYIIKKNDSTIGNKIYDLDLTQLLNKCQNNNYISSVPLNFINGLKKYRNFVHPGVEIRENKKGIKIADESIDLLWGFVNWLIDYVL